jgi:hypothetical protein
MDNIVPKGRKAVELAVKHGPKVKVAWDVAGKQATEQVKIQRARAANKKRAFDKARTLADGTVLRQLDGEQVIWVVFAGAQPVASYPPVEKDLSELVEHAKLSDRKTPDDYDRTRAKARAKRAAMKAGNAARKRVRRSDESAGVERTPPSLSE